jgi:hypothetical protein
MKTSQTESLERQRPTTRNWLMRKPSILGLLLLAACAQKTPVPSLRVQLMARCAAACDPAEAVEASVAVDATDDLWQCHCRMPLTTPAGI